MANSVFVSIAEEMEEPLWIKKVENFVLKAMDLLKFDSQQISVMFCDDVLMQKLNKEYRNIDSSTDVLSFEDGSIYLDEDGLEWKNMGDIAISIDMLKKNAEYFNCTQNDELKRLLLHGILHLNGLDHGDEHIELDKKPICDMLKLQEKTLLELQNEKII